MPQSANKEPGDNAYPRYQSVVTLPVNQGVAFEKGDLATVNISADTGSGNSRGFAGALIKVSTTTAKFPNGIYQVTRKISAQTGVATDGGNLQKVQCLGPRSRILLKAEQGLVRGQPVGYNSVNKRVHRINEIAAADITLSGTTFTENIRNSIIGAINEKYEQIIGRVFDIYSHTPTGGSRGSGEDQRFTSEDDIVIVDLVIR